MTVSPPLLQVYIRRFQTKYYVRQRLALWSITITQVWLSPLGTRNCL